jgi:hypothetical protein
MSGGARPRFFRSVRRAVAVGLLVLATTPVSPALAADSRGAASQDGWWNRLQGPADGEPEPNPLRPLIPPAPRPPTVPPDAIAVGGGAGQVDKVAAVGIDLALADGATVDGLTLRLTESTAGGANVRADQAKVLACPATVPWGPAQNGAWLDRPASDCSLGSAEGVRAADGTWTFDLTALGRLWGDPNAALTPNGVVLAVDPAASPSPVQVSWLNFDSGKVAVELAATPGAPLPQDGSTGPAPLAAESPAVFASAVPYLDSVADARAFPAEGGGIAPDPLAYASGRPTFAAKTAGPDTTDSGAPSGPPAESGTEPQTTPAAPPAQLRARPAVDFWESVPAPTVLLIPVAVGLAVILGLVLGPLGRPSPVFARQGGLSRALARRSPGGSDVGLRPPPPPTN